MQDELDTLRRLNNEKCVRLKQFGVDANAVPAAFQEQLAEYERIKGATGLLRLDDISLELWHQEQQLQSIDRAADRRQLQTLTAQLERQLGVVLREAQELQSLLTRFKSGMRSETKVKSIAHGIEREIEELRSKLTGMKSGLEDVDIESLMEKVQILHQLKHKPNE